MHFVVRIGANVSKYAEPGRAIKQGKHRDLLLLMCNEFNVAGDYLRELILRKDIAVRNRSLGKGEWQVKLGLIWKGKTDWAAI
ncbi:hypothetical protein ASE07_01765 [Noviherbaspirillum sp. Root189]|nr:hypothetical protein ASE07_01765 [Noviherbaspirillum sp. Root189]